MRLGKAGIKLVGLCAVLAVAGTLSARMAAAPREDSTRKVALIVMDSPSLPWASGRLLTAMVYAQQLKRAGIPVQLIFYSFGVQWLSILEELPSGKKTELERTRALKEFAHVYRENISKEYLVERYLALKDSRVPLAVCAGSAEGLGIKPELAIKKVEFAQVKSDPKGEMNIAPYVKDGYQVWVF